MNKAFLLLFLAPFVLLGRQRQSEPFIKQTFQLQKGDVIYAITDGFPYQFGGEKGKKFKRTLKKQFAPFNA